jgi:2'-hydroxyisoflavone reductase
MNRKILIIGGTGFIGSALARQFVKLKDDVTLFHREMRTSSPVNLDLKHILGDRKEPVLELRSHRYDLVIDTCGFSPDDFLILDFLDTKHYIFISSVGVYSRFISPFSNEKATKIDEDLLDLFPDLDKFNKHEKYGFLKLKSEEHVKMKIGNCSVVRPSIVLGQNENTGRLREIYQLPKTNSEIPFNSASKFQFIDILDLVALIIKVAEMPPGDDYNLVGPSISWQEFVSTFIGVFEIENYLPVLEVRNFPFWDDYPNQGIRSLTSKHSWITKHKFTSLKDSLLMFKLNSEQH